MTPSTEAHLLRKGRLKLGLYFCSSSAMPVARFLQPEDSASVMCLRRG